MKLSVNYLRNCDDGDHVVTVLKNSTLTIDDNCNFHTFMCSNISKYQSAMVKYLQPCGLSNSFLISLKKKYS